MSRYLSRLAARVQAAAPRTRAPVAGLEAASVSVVDAPSGEASAAARVATPPAPLEPPGARAPRVQGAHAIGGAVEAGVEQLASLPSADAGAPAAARPLPGARAETPPSATVVQRAVAALEPSVHAAARDLTPQVPEPARSVAAPSTTPAALGPQAQAPMRASRPNGMTPAAPAAPAAPLRMDAPPAPMARPADPPVPLQAEAQTARPAAPFSALAPRAARTERSLSAPQLDVHIGTVQLSVRTPAPPPPPAPPAPRPAHTPRAAAKPAFSAHRHYLREG